MIQGENMVQPLEIQYDVKGYDCGYGGPLKPFSLANYFQEAAGDQASQIGIGMEDMWAKGITWMLSRIDIRINAMPVSGQKVIARTWPSGTRKMFALRCLELVDSSGMKYAGAMYEYIVVDMKTRRLVRPEHTLPLSLSTDYPWPFEDLAPGIENVPFRALEEALSEREQKRNASQNCAGSAVMGGFFPVFSIEARNRHIDYNGHVNNAHFINWLCDAAPLEKGQRYSRIKVDFVHEILKDNCIEAWSMKIPDTSRPGTWLSALSRGKEVVARGMVEISDPSSEKEFPGI